MKLYCYCTDSIKKIAETWLIPSLKDEYELVLRVDKDRGKYVRYKKTGWHDIMHEKVKFILKAIQDNWNEVFVFSDPDVQFFQKSKERLLALLKSRDLMVQRDTPWGMLCAGFFICRANAKTLKLWQDVHDFTGRHNLDDQDSLNKLLLNYKNRFFKVQHVLMTDRARALKIKSSQRGLNPCLIKWGYLPAEFFGAGTLTGKLWSLGKELTIPENIVMHHANFCVGLEAKIAQLAYVRGKVNGI